MISVAAASLSTSNRAARKGRNSLLHPLADKPGTIQCPDERITGMSVFWRLNFRSILQCWALAAADGIYARSDMRRAEQHKPKGASQMKTNRDFIAGMLLGAIIVLGLVFITGAVQNETYNTLGNDSAAFRDVACSADGQTVYALDVETIYRSQDGGNTWTVVLKKQPGLAP